jgi:hypothetical protein
MTTPEAASPLPLEEAPLAAWLSPFRGGCLVLAVYCKTDH